MVSAEENYTKALGLEKQAQESVNKAQEDWNHVISGDWGIMGNQQVNTYRNALKKAKKDLENAKEATDNAKDSLDGATKAYDSNIFINQFGIFFCISAQ